MLAKGIANRHKTKRVSWRLHRGWLFFFFFGQSQSVTHTHCPTWLKWLKSTSLLRCTCSPWRAWYLVQIKVSSNWPTPVVPKGGEMGEGARQWKETSTFLLENLFKTPQWLFATWKIKLLFCLGLSTRTEFVLNTVRTPLPLTAALRSRAVSRGAGSVTTPTQPWPPDHHPSSRGPQSQRRATADRFSAEDQPIFSRVDKRQWQCLHLQCYFEQNLLLQHRIQPIERTQNLLETPFPMRSSDTLAVVQSKWWIMVINHSRYKTLCF